MKLSATVLAPVVLAAAAGIVGCGDDPAGHSSTGSAAAAPKNVTTINGEVPPGRVTAPDEVRVVQTTNPAGQEIQVFRSERLAGTRAAIHTHPYGGVSCVNEGEMTLFMEGDKPTVARKGDCYWMPPGHVMSAANTGDTRSVTLDYFTTPPGKPVWIVVERGQGKLQDAYGKTAGN